MTHRLLNTAKHFALVGPWPPYRGGIAQFTVELARALRRRGHEVTGLSFSRQYPERFFPGKTQFNPSHSGTDLPDAPRLIDSVSPRSWWRAGAYLRDLRPDGVVFQYWMPFFAPALGSVARRTILPDGRRPARVAVVHNALPHERHAGDLALSRYFFRTCDGLVALSGSVRQDLVQIVPGVPVMERSHPVYAQFGAPTPKDEARTALGLPPDAPMLLFFGFVRRYKGLDILLDALPRIRQAHPDVRLVVAGEFYEEKARYDARVAELGLSDRVRFEDRFIPDQDVPDLFGAADLVVQPYRSATQSGVVQVAFGMGVPVVTTDVGGFSEAVSHEVAGLVVPPENPEALADAVIRVLDDAELAERLRKGARANAGSEGWEAICEALEGFLINRPSGP